MLSLTLRLIHAWRHVSCAAIVEIFIYVILVFVLVTWLRNKVWSCPSIGSLNAGHKDNPNSSCKLPGARSACSWPTSEAGNG